MSSNNRVLQYSFAINEAFHQTMALDDSVFLIGQGVESPWYVGKTATGLLEKFGSERVIDSPVSENAVTGAAVGAGFHSMFSGCSNQASYDADLNIRIKSSHQ